ncbi:MAG: hypothetical protein M3P26_00055 [Gemmatimonadota bacterium]|nr:hypothetical protein [Gemmatimonadota bacterium]
MTPARWLSPLFFAALSVCSAPRLAPERIPNSQLIREDEIVASLGTTAYEFIHNLRPNFLSYRGETSFDRRTSRPYPNVYVDDQAFGPILILHSIPAADVSTIRLYRSWEAMTRYGTGNGGGVIAISTRR